MTTKALLSCGGLCSNDKRKTSILNKTTRDSNPMVKLKTACRTLSDSRRRQIAQTAIHVTTFDAPEIQQREKWYDKNAELWKTAKSEAELKEICQTETEKMIFLDLYAGFCGSCKAAFPALCRIAGNPDFQKDFLFVKGDVSGQGMREYVRSEGIRGIPTVMIFAPGGEKLVSFGASFRKINAVKANLVVMAANSGAQFAVDPNGYVIPLPSSQ